MSPTDVAASSVATAMRSSPSFRDRSSSFYFRLRPSSLIARRRARRRGPGVQRRPYSGERRLDSSMPDQRVLGERKPIRDVLIAPWTRRASAQSFPRRVRLASNISLSRPPFVQALSDHPPYSPLLAFASWHPVCLIRSSQPPTRSHQSCCWPAHSNPKKRSAHELEAPEPGPSSKAPKCQHGYLYPFSDRLHVCV